MKYSAGDCPVCADSGALLFVTDEAQGRVLIYCPACGCAWAHPSDAEKATTSQGPEEFGLRQMRAATLAEIDAAGLRSLIRSRHRDDEFMLS